MCFILSVSGDVVKPISSAQIINDSTFVCNENFEDTRKYFMTGGAGTTEPTVVGTVPTIYFVTPTYPRREQIAELTRLGQTLMHVPHLHWIVADDYDGCNLFLDYLLNRFGKLLSHENIKYLMVPIFVS